MKTFVAISIFLLCIVQASQAQSDSIDIKKAYRIWVIPVKQDRNQPRNMSTEQSRVQEGFLYEVKDSSVMISKALQETDYERGAFDVSKVDIRSIQTIQLRKKGSAGNGVLYGAIAGLAVGGIVDLIIFSSVKNNTSGKANTLGKAIGNTIETGFGTIAAVASTLCLTFTGMGIGAIIGSAKITIPINGSREQFDQNRSRLDGYSIKHSAVFENGTFSKLSDTLVDIDGHVYHTLALGGQVWMAENLKVTHFCDGSEIPGLPNKPNALETLYNWDAAADSRKICPAGWHVPSMAEWISLYNSLGGENGAVRKLEESFSATAKGSIWWSSSEEDSGHGQSLYLNHEATSFLFLGKPKSSGLPVRCIRD